MTPRIIPAKDWFGSGARTPYNGYHVFNKFITYPQQDSKNIISFLPGFPSGSYDWAKIDALIEEQHPLTRLYVEYIGQGESDKPENYAYSTFERADLVEAMWKYHHIDSTIVVTFDYSSLVAMELLRRQQEKIDNGELVQLSQALTQSGVAGKIISSQAKVCMVDGQWEWQVNVMDEYGESKPVSLPAQ